RGRLALVPDRRGAAHHFLRRPGAGPVLPGHIAVVHRQIRRLLLLVSARVGLRGRRRSGLAFHRPGRIRHAHPAFCPAPDAGRDPSGHDFRFRDHRRLRPRRVHQPGLEPAGAGVQLHHVHPGVVGREQNEIPGDRRDHHFGPVCDPGRRRAQGHQRPARLCQWCMAGYQDRGHDCRDAALYHCPDRLDQRSFGLVGQIHQHHPRRRRVLDVAAHSGLHLLPGRFSPGRAARRFVARRAIDRHQGHCQRVRRVQFLDERGP
ncbi:hypothetical protein LTR40_013165, partial [Exophiala xenobiotica]